MTDLIARAESAGAYDRTGRQIKVGDVLKVYHFQGARWRKHYYMYKQVIGEKPLGKTGTLYLEVSHLNMKDGDGYYIAQRGQVEQGIEIVQGIDWHHDRPINIAILRAHESNSHD